MYKAFVKLTIVSLHQKVDIEANFTQAKRGFMQKVYTQYPIPFLIETA